MIEAPIVGFPASWEFVACSRTHTVGPRQPSTTPRCRDLFEFMRFDRATSSPVAIDLDETNIRRERQSFRSLTSRGGGFVPDYGPDVVLAFFLGSRDPLETRYSEAILWKERDTAKPRGTTGEISALELLTQASFETAVPLPTQTCRIERLYGQLKAT